MDRDSRFGNRARLTLSLAAVALVGTSTVLVPVGAQGRERSLEVSPRVTRGMASAPALRSLGPEAPNRSKRLVAAGATTLSKTCEMRLGMNSGLLGFLVGANDDLGPFGSFQFLDPDAEFFDLVQFFADLETVNIRKLNRCRMQGEGDWGKVNVRTGDPGRKQTERFGCVEFIFKRMPWTGRVVFKTDTTDLGAGRFQKTSGKLIVLKIVLLDDCVEEPPTECEVPLQLLASGAPTPETFADFFAAEDNTGFVFEDLFLGGGPVELPWFEIVFTGAADGAAMSGDPTTLSGQVVGIPPFSGTGNFVGTSNEPSPAECGGTNNIMSGQLTGDLTATTLMGTFVLGGDAAMLVHQE